MIKSKLEDKSQHVRRHWRRLRKHPVIIPVATFAVLLVVTLVGWLIFRTQTEPPIDAHIVKLTVSGKQQVLPTRAATVRQLLQRLDIHINKGDVVEPALKTKIAEDGFRVNVYRARLVSVEDRGKKQVVYSAASSSRAVASEAGLKVYPEDIVERQAIEDFTRDGFASEKVVIDRARAVKVNLYGVKVTMRTHAKTVGGLLREKNVNLATRDKVQPALDTSLSKAAQVLVLRSGTKIALQKRTIPPPIQFVEDPSLSYGVTVVRQAGSPGRRLVTYQIKSVNGKVVSRKVLQSVVLRAPVKRIVARGKSIYLTGSRTDWMRAAGIPSSDYPYVNYIISRESNWRPNASNASGCLGLGQRCPGSVLTAACPNWASDPVCQLHHFTAYANGHHGGWAGAYNFWLANGYW